MPNVTVNISVTPPYVPFRQCKQLVSLADRLRTVCETRVQTLRSPNGCHLLPLFVLLCMCCVCLPG